MSSSCCVIALSRPLDAHSELLSWTLEILLTKPSLHIKHHVYCSLVMGHVIRGQPFDFYGGGTLGKKAAGVQMEVWDFSRWFKWGWAIFRRPKDEALLLTSFCQFFNHLYSCCRHCWGGAHRRPPRDTVCIPYTFISKRHILLSDKWWKTNVLSNQQYLIECIVFTSSVF